MLYATLYEVREYLRFSDSQTQDDALLLRFLRQAHNAIHTRRSCVPLYAAYTFDYPIRNAGNATYGYLSVTDFVATMNATLDISQGRLRLNQDLLTCASVVNGDGTTIDSDDYVLEPANLYPKHTVTLKSNGETYWKKDDDGSREQVIAITGVWGYHPDYTNAWVDSLDTVQNDPLTAVTTSLTVQDADGIAGDMENTRFQAGNLLCIEDEYVDILAVDYDTNILTVKRGAQGTTAAAHAKATAISIYRPPRNVNFATIRLTAWRYRQKDVDVFDKTAILGSGVRIIPSAIPPDVAVLLPPPMEDLA